MAEIRPKVHIFGHVHNSWGEVEVEGIKYVNVAMMSEAYQLVNVGKLI